MENRTKYLFKNTSILTISNFSSKILVFLLVPLYTNVLTTEEYGMYDLIMSAIQLCIPFFTLNIVDGVLRFLMNENEDKNQVKSIGFICILYSVFCITVLLTINNIFSFWTVTNGLEIFIWSYFIFYVFNQLLIHIAKGQEQIKVLGIAGVISTFFSIVGNILFLVVIPYRIKGFFMAYTLGQFTSAIYLCIKTSFFCGLTLKIDNRLKRQMLIYSFPLILGTLGWLINNVSDRFVVSWLCGLSDNGIYSVAYKIPTIMTTVQNIFLQAWTISAIKEYEQKDNSRFYCRIFYYMNGLMILSCSILIMGTKFISKILYAKDFYPAWQYVPFLLVSVVFGAAAGFIGPILSAKMDSKSIAKSTIYGAMVNLLLNVLLISIYGVQGAAVATAVSSLIIFLYRKKAAGQVLNDSRYKLILFSWVVITAQALLMIVDISIIWQLPLIVINLYIYRTEVVTLIYRTYKNLIKQ